MPTKSKRVSSSKADIFILLMNFHRPCAFPGEVIDHKGKIKKKYRYQHYHTPYEKLKSITDVSKYLKDGFILKMLDKIAKRNTDNELAERFQLARDKLFEKNSSMNLYFRLIFGLEKSESCKS